MSFTMSSMRSSTERGFNILAIPLAFSLLLMIGALIFGIWAFSQKQSEKSNVNTKVNAAVTVAKQQEADLKNAQFAQTENYPFRTYTSPTIYGSVVVKFPNTWSAYVIDDTNSSPYVDGYFYPNTVPDTQSTTVAFALRLQIVQESYSDVLNNIQSNVQQGQTTVTPYKAPNVPSVIGSLVTGKLPSISRSGTMVVLPLRNMTLELWTEAPQYVADFNNIVLPNFSFSP